jgi:UDP-N-acetyl-D-mannosaminuronic acid dehydrogenase
VSFQPRLAPEVKTSDARPFQTVAIIGLGYIGLPTAAVMAARGINVVGVDIDPKVVDTVNRGEIHVAEPLLDQIVKGAIESGKLKACATPAPADAFLIAVPTPITMEKKADLSHVMAAAELIAPVLRPGDLVILESTSPVGTTEKLSGRIAELRPDLRLPQRGKPGLEVDINIAYCPERVLPGRVIEELVNNDRAIGGLTPACTGRAQELYRQFVHGELVATDVRSAELCKLAENACRDVNIAFANELANVCETLDMNVWEVIRLANRHPRINILKPGPGVGGHCIAVDPWFIVEAAPTETPVIRAARQVNDGRPQRVVEQVRRAAESFHWSAGRAPRIACLGLAFKANVADIRESPALEIVCALADAQVGELDIVDPHISPDVLAKKHGNLRLRSLSEAIDDADLVVLLVDHREFSRASLRGARAILDIRGVLAPGDEPASRQSPNNVSDT